MVSALIDLVSRAGIDPAHVLAPGARGERRPVVAQAAQRLTVAQRLEMPEQGDALDCQLARQRGPDAGQQPDRLGCQQRRGLSSADHREAARLVAACRDLCQQPVGGEADRYGDADRLFPPRGRSGPARWRAARRAAPRCRRGRAPPRRSTAAASSGVSVAIMARICRPTATYFAKSGRITTASGQAFSALNIGMALRTP